MLSPDLQYSVTGSHSPHPDGPVDPLADFAALTTMVAHNAARIPDAPFLVGPDGAMSYESCVESTSRVAAGLARAGLRPGAMVLSLLSRRYDTVRALLAVSHARAVLAPVNVHLAPGPFRAILRYLSPDWVITEDCRITLLDRHAAFLPPRDRWIGLPVGRADNAWKHLEASARVVPSPAPADLCYVDFTSGSLGTPKGVPRTHGSIWAITQSAVAALGLRPADRHMSLFAPFAHPHEAVARAAYLGGTLVCAETLRPSALARVLVRHDVTCLMAVPTVYGLLARHMHEQAFSRVRLFESGGAVTPECLIDRFRRRLGVPVTPVWGCTEAGGIALAAPLDGARPLGAVGTLCPGFDARMVPSDTPGHVEAQEHGELLLRGPSIAPGYFRLPEETARAFTEGWYHSGDIFSRDPEGFFFFRGRTDEMIKVRGLKVFPTEIEQVLLRHPAVVEAAVVPGDDPDSHPVAFVVPDAGAALDERELRRFCRDRLAPFKVPRIVVRTALPKSTSGKVLKRNLRARR